MVLMASAPTLAFLSVFNFTLAPLAFLVLLPFSSLLIASERRVVKVSPQCTTTYMVLSPPQGVKLKGRLFFLHGWPDSLVLFLEHANALRDRGYECILLQLPGYPVTTTLPVIEGTVPKREWGYSFKEIVDTIAFTITTVNEELGPSQGETCLVGHDWGAFTSYLLLYKYSARELGLTRFVSLDVGLVKKMNARMTLLVLLYQTYLNIAWIMPRFIGDLLTRAFASLLGTPAKNDAQAAQNGLYREVWRTMAFKEWQGLKAVPPKGLPWLFCYGTAGPDWFMWSDEDFYAQVRASHPKSRVEAYEGEHWFFCHGASKERFIKELVGWMEPS